MPTLQEKVEEFLNLEIQSTEEHLKNLKEMRVRMVGYNEKDFDNLGGALNYFLKKRLKLSMGIDK